MPKKELKMLSWSVLGIEVDPKLLTADCLPGTQPYSGMSSRQPIEQKFRILVFKFSISF